MALLRYMVHEVEADWEEYLYHDVVQVRKGFVQTDNPLTIEALLYRGFELVEEPKEQKRQQKPRE